MAGPGLDRGAPTPRPLPAADEYLRGSSRLMAAPTRGRPSLAQLSRVRRDAGALRERYGLHPYRIAADHRIPLRRLLGLSADLAFRAVQPLRHADRFPILRRCLSPRGARRDPRLGAGAFP